MFSSISRLYPGDASKPSCSKIDTNNYFLLHFLEVLIMTGTFQLQDQEISDRNGIPRHPLPCPWSWAKHTSVPTPRIMYSMPPLFNLSLYNSSFPSYRQESSCYGLSLPPLQLPTPNIYFSLSLFQTLVSWVTGFSCNESIQVCLATVVANLPRSRALDLFSLSGFSRMEQLAKKPQGSPVCFLS